MNIATHGFEPEQRMTLTTDHVFAFLILPMSLYLFDAKQGVDSSLFSCNFIDL